MTQFKANMILALSLILLGRSVLGIDHGVDIPYGYDESPLAWHEMLLGFSFYLGGAMAAFVAAFGKIEKWVKS